MKSLNSYNTLKKLILFNYTKWSFQSNKGFTLIEMAIVLVIVGIILTLVFKGKELIDSSKVNHVIAQYNKILAAVNTFYERYGFYPGDGCTNYNPSQVTQCNGIKDGVLNSNEEKVAFWHLLINITQILPRSERTSVFGQEWDVWEGMPGHEGTWLDLADIEKADARIVCAIDKKMDDGNNNTGIVRSGGTPITWNPNTDCWSLSGQVDIIMRLLP